MRSVIAAIAGAMITGAAITSPTPAAAKQFIELFTSQGCSSCPRADALLQKLTHRDNLVALSFHVDYWDYLGWKDTLARKSHSVRQRNYARARRDNQVFTPQVVINGMAYAVGSDRQQIENALVATRKYRDDNPVAMQLSRDKSSLRIHIGAGKPPPEPATIYVAIVTPRATVNIKRGENHGRKMTYHNVVREIMPVGMWSGKAVDIKLPAGTILADPANRCAVFVQSANLGAVLAADWMPK